MHKRPHGLLFFLSFSIFVTPQCPQHPLSIENIVQLADVGVCALVVTRREIHESPVEVVLDLVLRPPVEEAEIRIPKVLNRRIRRPNRRPVVALEHVPVDAAEAHVHRCVGHGNHGHHF